MGMDSHVPMPDGGRKLDQQYALSRHVRKPEASTPRYALGYACLENIRWINAVNATLRRRGYL